MRSESEVRDDLRRVTRVLDNLAERDRWNHTEWNLIRACFAVEEDLYHELNSVLGRQ